MLSQCIHEYGKLFSDGYEQIEIIDKYCHKSCHTLKGKYGYAIVVLSELRKTKRERNT